MWAEDVGPHLQEAGTTPLLFSGVVPIGLLGSWQRRRRALDLTINLLGPVAVISGLGVAAWNRAVCLGQPPREEGKKVPVRYDAPGKADSIRTALGAMLHFGALLLGTVLHFFHLP